MKYYLIILIALVSCSKAQETASDEYVLIEFASKLEEEHHKIHPKDNLKSPSSP